MLPTLSSSRTLIQLTAGNDDEHVKQCGFNWIQLQHADTFRVLDQPLPEVVRLSKWHYPPRQKVSEVVLFWVVPVQSGDENATLRLAETNESALIGGR